MSDSNEESEDRRGRSGLSDEDENHGFRGRRSSNGRRKYQDDEDDRDRRRHADSDDGIELWLISIIMQA